MTLVQSFRFIFGYAFSFFKKALIVFLVFFAVITAFMYLMNKDKPHMQQGRPPEFRLLLYEKIKNPALHKDNAGKRTIEAYRSITCGLFGEVCTDKPQEAYKYRDNSFFGKIASWIASPYSVPPASGIAWAQDSFENAGFIPSAHAAEGIGFSSIKGYMNLWKTFRNVAFLLLVLIMLIIGFLIMFRVKIDPQTVISIESALPRIVITMILISFSFAIVGFLIDLMYLLIGVSVDLIWGYGLGFSRAQVISAQNEFMGAKFGTLWPSVGGFFIFGGGIDIFGVGSAMWGMVPGIFKDIINAVLIRQLAVFVVNMNLEKWKDLLRAPENVGILGFEVGGLPAIFSFLLTLLLTGWIVNFLPGFILSLIIALTVLFLMFKIFFILLSSYIKVIIYIIFAPIILLMEAIPGQNTFSWWIRNLIGELLAFPTVVLIMVVGNAMLAVNDWHLWNQIAFPTNSVPLIGPSANNTFVLPFLYGFQPQDFNMIVSLGIILLIPDFIKVVKGWVGVTESPFDLSLGMFFAGGTAVVGGALGGASTLHGWKNSLVGGNPYHGVLHSVPFLKGFADKFSQSPSNQIKTIAGEVRDT